MPNIVTSDVYVHMGWHTASPTCQYNTMLSVTHYGELTQNVWECCAHIHAVGGFP